jgi:hypothetical protein
MTMVITYLFSSNYPISWSLSIFHFLGLVKLLTLSYCPICGYPLSNFPGFLKSWEFIHCYSLTPQVHILCQFPRLVHFPRVPNSCVFLHLWKNINLGFVLLPSTNSNQLIEKMNWCGQNYVPFEWKYWIMLHVIWIELNLKILIEFKYIEIKLN